MMQQQVKTVGSTPGGLLGKPATLSDHTYPLEAGLVTVAFNHAVLGWQVKDFWLDIILLYFVCYYLIEQDEKSLRKHKI